MEDRLFSNDMKRLPESIKEAINQENFTVTKPVVFFSAMEIMIRPINKAIE